MKLSSLHLMLQSALLSTIVVAAGVQAQDYPAVIQKLQQQGVSR